MSWYYADQNERRGPVDNAAFDALVRSGTVLPETLVWREGMANWEPLSTSSYTAPAGGPPPIGSASAGPAAATMPGVEMGVCSESGRTLPRSELVEIEGRLVSAEYKNVVLQRIREGVSATGSAEDAEQIALRLREADWHISAGDCISRGWLLVKSRFWLTTGATLIVYLLVVAAAIIPFGQIIVQGPLFAGLYWLLLKIHRGQPAALEDAFAGFSRGWGHSLGVTVITGLAMLACMVPGLALIFAGVAQSGPDAVSPLAMVGGLLTLVGVLAGIYLVVAWIFALPLVVDKRFEMWPALKLSKQVVSMHWWKVFWLLLCTGLVIMGIVLVGLFAVGLIVGLISSLTGDSGVAIGLAVIVGFVLFLAFFTALPLVFGALMVAYEDIFAPASRPA